MTLDFDNFVDLEKSQTWKAKLDFLKKQNFSSSNVKKLINDAESSINSIDMNVDSTSYTVEQIYSKLKDDVKEYSKYDKSDKSANSWYRFYTAIDQVIPMLLTLSSYKSWMIQFFYVAHNKMLDLLTQLVDEQNEFMKIKFKAEAWEKMYTSAKENQSNIRPEDFDKIQAHLKSELDAKEEDIQTLAEHLQQMENTIKIVVNAQKERELQDKKVKEQVEKPVVKEQKPKPMPAKYPQKEEEEAKIKQAVVESTYQSEENPEPAEVESDTQGDKDDEIDEMDEDQDEIEPLKIEQEPEPEPQPQQEPDPQEVDAFMRQQGFQDETSFMMAEQGSKSDLSYPLETAAEIEEILGLNKAELNNRKKQYSMIVTLLMDSEYENYSYSKEALAEFIGLKWSTIESHIQNARIERGRVNR